MERNMRWVMIAFRLVALALFVAGCARTLSPKTLAGEWCQDMDYIQSTGLLDQLAEVVGFEDYELYFSNGRVVATCVEGKEPASTRVYWDSAFSLSKTAGGEFQLLFRNLDQHPVAAIVSFEGKRLIVKIGERRMGFVRNEATNLRNKGYVPKT